MSRSLPSPIPFALAIGAIALLAPATPVQASAFWGGWFTGDRPVVYRPIVTPRTYYFAPAGTVEVAPAPRHRHHGRHPHHRRP
ncbi:hypothetical protein [Phreatobacter cathodiphilus]|uniref:Uncharacterized protein n=1 Tax=Phreatobacter cathodiphilus TaxID=1868589 RepID=A0A2S0NGC9_9HYPH|nr:hypothetical protein [Phreatobacter cathodiphilus]AVO47127.1 hypothetical protein C6569_19890 [Phreatobacter cathodiphilus]